MGVVPAPLVFFWTLVGAAVGALVAALIARTQFVGARRDYRSQLERKEIALERLRKELEEDRSDFVQRSDDYLRQLAALKRTRASLTAELEEARRAATVLQNDLETLRVSARESESRLSSALDAARAEATAGQNRVSEDLALALEAAERARGDLSRRLAALESDCARLESELDSARRAGSERQESLRSILGTLREQYSLATTEREALARELDAERAHAESLEAALHSAREEYCARLDAEHQESMEMIARMWEYVHEFTRARSEESEEATPEPEPAPEPESTPEPKQESMPEQAPKPKPEPMREPLTTDREVATPHAAELADRCPSEEYDIERALEEALPTLPMRAASAPEVASADKPAPAAPAAPLAERGWRAVPAPTTSSSSTRVRRPISAMRRGDDVLVVCDDGSVWMRRPTGWIEEPPIPGSDANGGGGDETLTPRADPG